MTTELLDTGLSHERVHLLQGPRSGLGIAVALHSTRLGPALGGCRIRAYEHWSAGLADALNLSEAMTYKAALAGLDHGGGKTVVILPPGAPAPTGTAREDLLLDVGDAVAALAGDYITGPDVGTGPTDMAVIAHRTEHVMCRPHQSGGSGDSGPATADGAFAAVLAVADHRFPDRTGSGLAGLRVGVLGVGSVGSRLSAHLAAAGAQLILADVDPGRRAVADQLDAEWTDPARLPLLDLDILVPAAVGGLLTDALVPRLRCTAVVGPANNQLADDHVATTLHRNGVLWAPDYVVSAGGIISAVARELHHQDSHHAAEQVRGIATTLAAILRQADTEQLPPHSVAQYLARARLA